MNNKKLPYVVPPHVPQHVSDELAKTYNRLFELFREGNITPCISTFQFVVAQLLNMDVAKDRLHFFKKDIQDCIDTAVQDFFDNYDEYESIRKRCSDEQS